MPWKHVNGSSFYYRSVRQGGQVRSEYVGSGDMAEIAALADRLIRSRRKARLLDELIELDALKRAEAESGVAEFLAIGVMVFRAIMAAAGYRRHERGQWRKNRMPELAVREPSTMPARSPSRPTARERHGLNTKADWDKFIPHASEIMEIFEKASRGDASVLGKLRILLEIDEEGTLAKLNCCDSGSLILERLAQRASGDDLALRESLIVEAERLREEMAGPDPTPSERLLAERVMISWLSLRRYELDLLRRGNELGEKLREEFYRQIARNNRALLDATKALATVRKLALPVLQMQLNLASQQMINGQGVRGRADRAPASLESHE